MRLILATLWLKKVHLLPVAGLVRNTGVDISGVHGSLTNALRALLLHNHNVAPHAPQEIAWLEDVSPNCDYVAGIRDFFARVQAMALRRQAECGKVLFRRSVWPRREVRDNLDPTGAAKLLQRALLSYICIPSTSPQMIRALCSIQRSGLPMPSSDA